MSPRNTYGSSSSSKSGSSGSPPDDPRKHAALPKDSHSFPSRNVIALHQEDFSQKVVPMEKALVYFYDSYANRDINLEDRYLSAADRLHNATMMFAALDCSYERGVCDYYKIYQTPLFMLFSNGFDVSTINKPESFSVDDIEKFMVWSPVLSKSRAEEGKEFLKRGERPKMYPNK